ITDHDAPQSARFGARGLSLSVKGGVDHNLGQRDLDGVLTYRTVDGAHHALEIHAAPGPVLADTNTTPLAVRSAHNASSSAAVPPKASLLIALAFAFLGGLILNVMPCVLPVLSIKALSIASGAHAGRARRDGVFYLAGVLVTFIALA